MIERECPCKVNLLLNVLGKRPDGFHELETVLQPVACQDRLQMEEQPEGIGLSCNEPALPLDDQNLVHRAARLFLNETGIKRGVRIHLEKEIPLSAGLGGGSSDAAHTLLGLNELFQAGVGSADLARLAASLGSDVPFFLQNRPALATGRGEKIAPLESFGALRGTFLLLVHPGFGVPTPWAYAQLAKAFAGWGQPGRAQQLVARLQSSSLEEAVCGFYNALEAPVLKKYPVLNLYQKFLKDQGAAAALMSGSGSSTFGLFTDLAQGRRAAELMPRRFGGNLWIRLVPLAGAWD